MDESTAPKASMVDQHHQSKGKNPFRRVESIGNEKVHVVEKISARDSFPKRSTGSHSKNRVVPSLPPISAPYTSHSYGNNENPILNSSRTHRGSSNAFHTARSDGDLAQHSQAASNKKADTRLKPSLSDSHGNMSNPERAGRLLPSIPNPWRTNPNTEEVKKNSYHGVAIQRVRSKSSAARARKS